jgi:hypothetical protein
MKNNRHAKLVHRIFAVVLLLLPIAIAACNQNGGSGY